MKKHAIIPIFIPHLGCPHACIFCDQNKITAKDQIVSSESVMDTCETWLSTLSDVEVVELAFYGGSFTAIPMELQNRYLDIALKYKRSGKIDKIHLSTRPDYINRRILDNLKAHEVDTIELGVQSFDENVLKLSERGHNSACVYESSALIKEYGFELGLQLMIGLPGDSLNTCIYSAKEAVKIAPDIARLYPTIVVKGTGLYDEYLAGRYIPLSREEAVYRTKEMYKILTDAGINIIRVGLKASEIINEGAGIDGGVFHPAFRQLVEGEIAKEKIDLLLSKQTFSFAEDKTKQNDAILERCREQNYASQRKVLADVFSCSRDFSNMLGNRGRNRNFFAAKYPELNIAYKVDNSLARGEYKVILKYGKALYKN